MDKKIVHGIVDGMVKNVMNATGLDELEARSLVGIAIRKNANAIENAIAQQVGKMVVVAAPPSNALLATLAMTNAELSA